jgi:multidrug resistance efflux pump
MAQSDAARVKRLDDATITQQKREQTATALEEADAAYRQAQVDRDVARLNLERSTVKAPADGIVTNLTLRAGNYVSAGSPVMALIDSGSFYVAGYFEENKLERIRIGAPAKVRLMGNGVELKGHVASFAGGIEDRERTDSGSLLANVTPTFNWVRLAQRIPVRIALENVPDSVHLVAGRTASVYIGD